MRKSNKNKLKLPWKGEEMKRKQQLEIEEGPNPRARIFKQSSNYTFNCNGPGLFFRKNMPELGVKNYLKFRHNESCWGNYANFIQPELELLRSFPHSFPAFCPAFRPLRVLFFQVANEKKKGKCCRKVKVRFMQLQIHLATQSGLAFRLSPPGLLLDVRTFLVPFIRFSLQLPVWQGPTPRIHWFVAYFFSAPLPEFVISHGPVEGDGLDLKSKRAESPLKML